MSAASSEEQFLCSICLEVFSEPVSTPCGHNFCKRCISQHWDTSSRCFCPLCKEVFSIRPQLKKNTFISEMVSQWKLQAEVCSKRVSRPAEVQCDVCSEPKLKAVKSCLVCLSSFCESHLQPHLTESGLKGHQLMEPEDNLEDRMCPKHQRPLELFCGTDQSCVCTMCGLFEHKGHELLSLGEACERRRTSLQNMVEQRRLKVQEIQRCLELSETENQREVATGIKAFTALMQSVQSHLDHFLEQLQEKQRNNQRQAQQLLQQLQQEIHELENPLHFLQRCPSLSPALSSALSPAGLKDWSSVSFEPKMCEGNAARALSELEKSLPQEISKVFEHLPKKDQLRRAQKFAVNITLDPDTANPTLVLSKDLKQVHHSNVKKKLPDSPQRFDRCPNVLGKQRFSSGRFYFEVQVTGKTNWDLGVAQECVSRKGKILLSPQNGFWTIWLRNSIKYSACTDSPVPLSLQRPPQMVGVFVDYRAGLVSFYDVDSADLLYSFTGCIFNDKLVPYFCPCVNDGGKNSAPLIISAVKTQTITELRMDSKK